MDLLTYVNSYHICAINDIPAERLKDVYAVCPCEWQVDAMSAYVNIRFQDGIIASSCFRRYAVGDLFDNEAVITWSDALLQFQEPESEIEIGDLI